MYAVTLSGQRWISYSWINGYAKRYGLVYIDYENGNKRIPKDSYYWYRDFIESQEV